MNKLFNTILLNRVSLYGSILSLCCIILLGGCKDNPVTPDGLVEAKTKTTSGGNEWTSEDAVGIFMLSEDGSVPSDILTVNSLKADNIKYIVTPDDSDASSGTLTAAEAGNKIFYPQDGSDVDFISYYPYRATPQTDPYLYSVSLTDQSVPEDLDILWGKGSGFSKTNPEVDIDMNHVLSKITFNLKAGDGMYEDLTDATVTITGMAESVQIDLNDGTISNTGSIIDISANSITPATDYEASFSAIIAPASGTAGRSIEFEIETEIFTLNIPEDDTFESGKHYLYEVTVKRTGVEIGDVEIVGWIDDDRGDFDISLRGIYTAEDLKQFSDDWNATGTIIGQDERDIAQMKVIEKWSDNSQFFGTIYLRADIDMSGITDFNPIGSFNYTDGFDYGFTGVFDGNGHTISNLTIQVDEYAGLFGIIGGQVSNIIIKDCDITADLFAGGIAGFNYQGTITGCEIDEGTVTATDNSVGGIVGWNEEGTIIRCEVDGGTIMATNTSAGGIVGYTTGEYASIENCTVSGTSEISADSAVGGIAGNNQDGTIISCEMTGGIVTATNNFAGGIVGKNEGEYAKIENCTVSGTSEIEANYYAGGITGVNYGTITGCKMTGGMVTTTIDNAGGIAGINEIRGTITGCEMTGGTVTSSTSSAGGIVGWNKGATITGCKMTGGAVIATISAGGIAGINEIRGTITGCEMTGGTVTSSTSSAGGIVGWNEGATITGCKMTGGAVIATNSAGGIVGINYEGTITGCISASESILGINHIGIIVGYNFSGTITTCFWSAITGFSDVDINDGGTITGGGEFLKTDVKETGNFFTNIFENGKTPIELMNEALEAVSSDYGWISGNAVSGWYPIAVKK